MKDLQTGAAVSSPCSTLTPVRVLLPDPHGSSVGTAARGPSSPSPVPDWTPATDAPGPERPPQSPVIAAISSRTPLAPLPAEAPTRRS